MRKTLLLEQLSPMEIEYPEKFMARSKWQKFKGAVFKKKATAKSKKIFISE